MLADVELKPSYERLYQNFSGDISGRYLEALSAPVPERHDGALDALLPRLLRCQCADGRFGREDLDFSAEAIDTEHMALLWGNGRLLTGLLARYRAKPEPAVLDTARRLGEFLLRVRGECSRPEVAQRLEGMGAKGLICFTQLIEPLTLLGQATGDRRYWDEARAIASSLPPRGVQHTHGYLATLRGILLLHEATGDPALLRLVEDRDDDLLRSPDYLVDGGVLEFFGAETKNLSPEDLRKLWTLDTKDPQDEGCAEADLVRLSLNLWRRTGRREDLACAERCLFNHFFFNQFSTGDFGHHIVFKNGWRPSEQPGMAWWCCTMHGYRAFADVLRSIVTRDGEALRVNLYLEGSWSDGTTVLQIERLASASPDEPPDRFRFRFVHAGPDAQTLCLRQPDWARPLSIRLNGREIPVERQSGFVSIRRTWHAGDDLIATLPHSVRLETRDGRMLRPEDMGDEPVEAALFYGPYLLAVHEADQPLFFRRPWMFPGKNASTIELPENWERTRLPDAASNRPEDQVLCPVAFRLAYTHGGWPNESQVVFRPLSWSTAVPQQEVIAVWTHFRRTPRTASAVPPAP